MIFSSNIESFLRQIKRSLPTSKSYSFATAYFDFKSFKQYFSSFEEAINNGVVVKFLLSNAISQSEFKRIKAAKALPLSEYISHFSNDVFSNEEISKLHKWINDESISFRIAFKETKGIFHNKMGFLELENGNVFAWQGSANHTHNGLSGVNSEQISFWNETQGSSDVEDIFNSMWSNSYEGIIVIDANDVFMDEIESSREDQQAINYDWYLKRWDKTLLRVGNNLVFIIDEELPTYFLPPGTGERRNKEYIIQNPNKLAILKWLEENNDVFIPASTMSFLKDNITTIENLLKRGFEIKNNFNSIINTKEYLEFLENSNTLLRQPYDQQLLQSFFALTMKKSLNFSVPGTGKTMVSLVLYNHLKKLGIIDRIVVIGPTSSHEVWADEFLETFGISPKVLNISEIKGNSDNKYKTIAEGKSDEDMFIMHYASAAKYSGAILQQLNEKDLVIIDEAHYIKNNIGVWGRAITKLARESKYSLLLTGTPVANNETDIHNLLDITFGESFVNYFIASDDKERLISSLHMKVTYDDLKMKYKQIDTIIDFELDENQISFIKKINKQILADPSNILSHLIKRWQATSSVELSEGLEFTRDESPKLKKLLELIQEGKNIVIWANFQKSIESIKASLEHGFPNSNIYTYFGKDSVTDRIDSINNYKKNGGILIASPHTLAEAVSLHKHTDYTIYFEFGYNLIHWQQSKNRTFRLGMEQDMEYFILRASNDKVEQKILERLMEKTTKQSNMINFSENNMDEDTMEDIRNWIEVMT